MAMKKKIPTTIEKLWKSSSLFANIPLAVFNHFIRHKILLFLNNTTEIQIFARSTIGFLKINSKIVANYASSFVIALQLDTDSNLLGYNCDFRAYLAQVLFFFSIPITDSAGKTTIHDFAYLHSCFNLNNHKKQKSFSHSWLSSSEDQLWIWENGEFYDHGDNIVPMSWLLCQALRLQHLRIKSAKDKKKEDV
eukprot:Awhi_evm2s14508